MKPIVLIFMLFSFISNSHAQSFERKVIAAAGKETSNGSSSHSMIYTVGEPMIYFAANSSNILNNGFIQPIPSSVINPIAPSGLVLANGDIVVYPNPFGNYLMVNGPEENEEEIKVQLIDQQGKSLFFKSVFLAGTIYSAE